MSDDWNEDEILGSPLVRPAKQVTQVTKPAPKLGVDKVVAVAVKDVTLPPAVQTKVRNLAERAKQIQVRNNSEYLAAAEFLRDIKLLRNEVDSTFDPIIERAKEAKRAADATRAEAVKQKELKEQPLLEAAKYVSGVMVTFNTEQERKAIAESNRIKAENEARIRAQAEQDNFERAQELSAQGDVEGAAQALDAPVEIPDIPVQVQSTVPKVAGLSPTKRYVVQYPVTLMKLVQAVAAGKAPLEALEANNVFLNRQATAFQKEGELMPGVWVVVDRSIRTSNSRGE